MSKRYSWAGIAVSLTALGIFGLPAQVVAQEETKDLYSVIDLLTDKVGRQLKKHLEKFKAKKVRSLSTGEVLSASEEI